MKRFPIHRTRIGKDIVAEFVVPPTKKLQKMGRVAIVGKGAPGMPGASTFLEFLAREGFYAILPRYHGTWESGGTFLKNEPTDDLRAVMDAITEDVSLTSFYEKRNYAFPKNPRIYLFVGSFGGPAGMFLAQDPRVSAVFAYCPVVDWRLKMKVEPLETFVSDTHHIYGEGYRFAKNAVEKLKSGTFYNPATARERIDGEKIHIFHTKDDNIVAFTPVERLAAKIGAHFTAYPRGGHGGASSLMESRTWRKVLKTIENSEDNTK